MSQVGRPRALDEMKRREICALVSAGCGLAGAARYVGCAVSTIRREALRNEDFHETLRQAELAAQLTPLRALRDAASKHWRAAAWLLERTHPDQFAKPDTKLLKPDDVTALVEQIVEMAAEQIDDSQTRERFYRRLLAMSNHMTREFLAAERPRRDPKRAKRMLNRGAA